VRERGSGPGCGLQQYPLPAEGLFQDIRHCEGNSFVSLLGIDVGTTGCKAAAFDPDGRLLSLAYEEYDVKSASPGRAELDPPEVWAKIVKVIRAAVESAKA